MRSALLVAGALALLAGCGGSDGMATEPADVAGFWAVDVTNADSARLTGCTEDLATIEGFTVAGLAATSYGCQASYSEVTQFDTSFTMMPFAVICSDGSTPNGTGSGDVEGNFITGQEDLFWSSTGIGRQQLFRGSVDGDNLELDVHRMVFTGKVVGACDLDPNLHFSGTIGSNTPGPEVVLEATPLETPSVTAMLDTQSGICEFNVSEWSFELANIPQSASAGETSLNDVSLTDVVIEYEWDDPKLQTAPRTVGLGGVLVRVNGTNAVAFAPIAVDDLTVVHQGSAANLTLTFNGTTLEGLPVSATVIRPLSIDPCS